MSDTRDELRALYEQLCRSIPLLPAGVKGQIRALLVIVAKLAERVDALDERAATLEEWFRQTSK